MARLQIICIANVLADCLLIGFVSASSSNPAEELKPIVVRLYTKWEGRLRVPFYHPVISSVEGARVRQWYAFARSKWDCLRRLNIVKDSFLSIIGHLRVGLLCCMIRLYRYM